MTSLRTSLLASSLLITAACSQPGVQVENKGGLFFGQQEIVTVGNTVPAQQPAFIAQKYQEDDYSTPTPVDVVDIATLDQPAPVEVQALEPLEQVSTSGGYANSTFSWPVEGQVLSHFGPKQGGLVNDGINIAASEGEPIWAAAGGEVAYAGASVEDYGNMVIIRHDNGWLSAYGHASDVLVKKGEVIKQGDLLGYVGQSGNVAEPQLHFGLRQGDKPVDPLGLLPRRIASR